MEPESIPTLKLEPQKRMTMLELQVLATCFTIANTMTQYYCRSLLRFIP